MGVSSSNSEVDEICRKIQEESEAQIERNRQEAERKINMIHNNVNELSRQLEEREDRMNFILDNQKYLGYNMNKNPHLMFESELNYWYD